MENQVQAPVTMKSRIIELAQEGLSKKAIENRMREEGFSRIRYGYIFVILKDLNIVVPKAKPGKKASPKAETVEVVEAPEPTAEVVVVGVKKAPRVNKKATANVKGKGKIEAKAKAKQTAPAAE